MTKPTGRAPGRPKGALNRVSRETRDKAAASGMLPHEFLLTFMRGEAVDGYTPSFAERLDAAKAAAPFFAPKLSAVNATMHKSDPREMSDEELTWHIRSVAAARGAEWPGDDEAIQ